LNASLFKKKEKMYSAAAVYDPDILNKATEQKIVIRDSKKMTPRQRKFSYEFLIDHCLFGVGYCDEKEIDELGITRCNVMCMHRAIDDLLLKHPSIEVEKINVDGVLFQNYRGVPHELVVRGESKHIEIAMASILAKNHRDQFMMEMCEKDPELDKKYNIKNNKGYGTAKHIEGIRRHGLHKSHRKLFVRNHHQPLRFL
jgi:ribonuclease HII